MLPIALAGMGMKRFTTPLIKRFGYRNVLVVNTVLVGIGMASFGVTAPGQPLVLHILQLVFFGAVNSLQFTAMNTVTLRDLDGSMASSGNSLLSMVQMLAMSLGVAAASSVLGGYTGMFGAGMPVDAIDTLHIQNGSILAADLAGGYAKRISLYAEVRNVFDETYVSSAQNIANSLNATSGLQNGAAILAATTGSVFAGAPRNVVAGMKLSF